MADPSPGHPMALRSGWPLPDIDTNIDPTRYHQRHPYHTDTDSVSASSKKISPYESFPDLSTASPMIHENTPQMTSQSYTAPATDDKDPKKDKGVQQHSPEEPYDQEVLGPDDAPRTRSSTYGVLKTGPEVPPVPALTTVQPPPGHEHAPSVVRTPISPTVLPDARPASRNYSIPISSIVHTNGPTQASPPAVPRPSTSTRSPFTSPIACPPRNRPNQILLINTTSTTTLTNLILRTLRPILPHALEVTGYNAPYPAPTAIESAVDTVLSSETVLRDLAKYTTNNGETIQNYDGLLVASFNKHPLIDALRESYDVPVIGILEASLYVARMLGGRFGIVTTSTRIKIQIDDAVAAAGLSHFFTGIECLHVTPHELLSLSSIAAAASSSSTTTPPSASSRVASPFDNNTGASSSSSIQPQSQLSGSSSSSTAAAATAAGAAPLHLRTKEELYKRLATQSRTLVARGADTVILGSEFLCSHEAVRAVKNAVRNESDGRRTVNVVEPVEAGVAMLNGLVGLGMPTAKKGLYQAERDPRRARGQTWL